MVTSNDGDSMRALIGAMPVPVANIHTCVTSAAGSFSMGNPFPITEVTCTWAPTHHTFNAHISLKCTFCHAAQLLSRASTAVDDQFNARCVFFRW